jgi:tungstate transport system substrate-binding protein
VERTPVRTASRFLFLALIGGLAASCGNEAQEPQLLRVAVTTSTQDSGLLEVLVSAFEQECDCRVDVIAAGTGRALKLGERGDVDALLVHARDAEDAFMAAGYGVRREDVMYNEFVLLGPSADPAQVSKGGPTAALQEVASSQHPFVSRGDDSGTHKRELALWRQGGGRPDWNGYLETGRGMGATLIIADEVRGYVLSDRGTYLRFRKKIDLVPLVQDSDELRNPYGAIVVNPARHPRVARDLADRFVDFLLSPVARRMIRELRIDGQQLFFSGDERS